MWACCMCAREKEEADVENRERTLDLLLGVDEK